MKSSSPTKPIYGDMIAAAAPRPAKPEEYDRLTRKDFWNDPERWVGIDDPRETMIWEVRRPHVIDVRPVPDPPPNPYQNANPQQLSQLSMFQQAAYNQARLQAMYDPYGFRLGRH